MINVGLVGFGFGGRYFHAPVMRGVAGLRLAAIVHRHGAEAEELYPEVRVVRSLDELLALPDLQLIVVTTPNPSHYELARQSLMSGRHVVIDKPMTPTSAEAKELARIAEEKRLVLSVYQNRRWDGDFLTVKKLIAEGVLGQLISYESHYERYRPQRRPQVWRERNEAGSGVLFDIGVHLIDQAMSLFGRPKSVFAEVRCEREGAVVDDAFDVVLHYDRMRAFLRGTMFAAAPGPRFVLHGVRGSYVSQHFDPQEEALKRGEAPRDSTWGAAAEETWGMLSTSQDDKNVVQRTIPTERGDYCGYYENVRDAILGQATLSVTPEQAIDVLRAIELARESSRKGCVVPWSQE